MSGPRTLHPAYRVSDLSRSLRFYSALGYEQVGRVDLGGGSSHLAVQVDDLAAFLEDLSQAGLQPEGVQLPGGPDGPRTSWLTDPDGYRLELVQWPPGHADGLTRDDFS